MKENMQWQATDIATCGNCGCRFLHDAGMLPRVERCPQCGDAVLLSERRPCESDAKSFWAGFFFGRLGVLWAAFRKGRSGADHAAAGHFFYWFSGIAIAAITVLLLGAVVLVVLFGRWLWNMV